MIRPEKTMSAKTVDVLLGQPTANDFEADLYILTKLADQVIAAFDAADEDPYVRYGIGRTLPRFVAPARPELEFTLPLPEWEAQ